jgi:Sodium/calcium exchanger protein
MTSHVIVALLLSRAHAVHKRLPPKRLRPATQPPLDMMLSEDHNALETNSLLGNNRQRSIFVRDIHALFCHAYINVLLVFLPFAFLSGSLGWSSTTVFVTNFLALIPLASMLSFATDELSKTVGMSLGGLLNITFGNATELIVTVVALLDGQIKLIQTTMLGSILSSLLLVISRQFSYDRF